jgi:DNA-binding transcriptional LysR family regulator
VLLATTHPAAVDDSVRLETLSGSEWVGFAREDGPAWWDEVVAVLRRHGHRPPAPAAAAPLIAEVKLVAVAAGGTFALAPQGWGGPLPEAVTWRPLAGSPLVRRTWVVWPAAATRRDLAALVAAFDAAAG